MAEKPLIAYIRQSRKKEKTISLDSQREKIKAWARFEGETLAPEVVEQGVSGSKHWQSAASGRRSRRSSAARRPASSLPISRG